MIEWQNLIYLLFSILIYCELNVKLLIASFIFRNKMLIASFIFQNQ